MAKKTEEIVEKKVTKVIEKEVKKAKIPFKLSSMNYDNFFFFD